MLRELALFYTFLYASKRSGDLLLIAASFCLIASFESEEHIQTVLSKVSKAIGFLKHTKSFLPEETLKTLYTGIVEPHFRYCSSVWGCCGMTEISQLQKVQNRAARIVTGSNFDTPGQPLIKGLGWSP